MWKRFVQWFRKPTFNDLDKARPGQNLKYVLLAVLAVMCIYILYWITARDFTQVITAFVILVILTSVLIILRRGYVRLADMLFTSLMWLFLMSVMAAFGGIRNLGFATIVGVVIISFLTLGVPSGVFFLVLCILSAVGLTISGIQDWLPVFSYENSIPILVSYSLALIATLLLLSLIVRNLTHATHKSTLIAETQRDANAQLEERRAYQESKTEMIEKRNRGLQVLAEIAEASLVLQDERALTGQFTNLLAEHIQLEHVNIFLLNEAGDSAILFASNSQAGQSLIAQDYRLSVSPSEYVITTSRVAIVMQCTTGGITYQIEKPANLTETVIGRQSVPLATKEKLIGLLDIQDSTREISADEQAVLQTLAGQMAIILDNKRLIARLQDQVREISQLAGQSTQEAWKPLEEGGIIGFQYDQMQVTPLGDQFPPEVLSRLQAGEISSYITSGLKSAARLLAPIKLRGTVIGVIGYELSDPQHDWQSEEISMLETVAAQVSLGLENSRLVTEAQNRARREQMIGSVASRIRETLDLETVLKTTAQEMQRALNLKETEIRMGAPQDHPAGKGKKRP